MLKNFLGKFIFLEPIEFLTKAQLFQHNLSVYRSRSIRFDVRGTFFFAEGGTTPQKFLKIGRIVKSADCDDLREFF